MQTNTEIKVANKAVKLLQNEFNKKFRGFKSHFKGERDKDNKPLADSKITRRGKHWTGKKGDKIYFLNKIVLKMSKHGFVQHYGVNNRLRAGHEVNRKNPKTTTFLRHYHNYKLPAHEFIDSAVQESGAIPLVAKEISEIRGYMVMQNLLDDMAKRLNRTKK